MIFKLYLEIRVEMKQSDPGLRRNVVLWGLGSRSGLWEERERSFQGRDNSTYQLPDQLGTSVQMPWVELASIVTRSQSSPAPV